MVFVLFSSLMLLFLLTFFLDLFVVGLLFLFGFWFVQCAHFLFVFLGLQFLFSIFFFVLLIIFSALRGYILGLGGGFILSLVFVLVSTFMRLYSFEDIRLMWWLFLVLFLFLFRMVVGGPIESWRHLIFRNWSYIYFINFHIGAAASAYPII